MRDGLRVAVVGATGMVGRIVLELLARRRFPVKELNPFSSGGRRAAVRFRGRVLPAPGVSREALRGADLVFMVSSDAVSRRYSRSLASAGTWVIDDSSACRMDPGVPLVIPEVNAHILSPSKRLIAGPNCTVTGLAVAGHPLYKKAGARRIHLASYQAVSGAGRRALLEYYDQLRRGVRVLREEEVLPRLPRFSAKQLPQPIAFSLFPHVGKFDGGGDSGEETKVRDELRKLWGDRSLRVSSTTVRVPVIRGHSLAVWMETSRRLAPSRAEKLLRGTPGVRVWRRPAYPTAHTAAGTDPVHVGRIRRSGAAPNELCLWIFSDNLLKGAALNSLHIAEHLLRRRWLRAGKRT